VVTGFLQTKKQKTQKKTSLLLLTGEQQRVKDIEPNVVAAVCSLREKILPLVPKSTFGSLKKFQEMTETATSSQNVCYMEVPSEGIHTWHMAQLTIITV